MVLQTVLVVKRCPAVGRILISDMMTRAWVILPVHDLVIRRQLREQQLFPILFE